MAKSYFICRKISALLCLMFVLFACSDDADEKQPVSRLKKITVHTPKIILSENDSATIAVSVDEPGFVLDVTKLELSGSSGFTLSSVNVGDTLGSYLVVIKDNGSKEIYKETIHLEYKAKGISSNPFTVMSKGATKGFYSFSFKKSLNKALKSDVVLEKTESDNYTAHTGVYMDMSNMIASFEAEGTVYVGDVVQESGVTPNDFTQEVEYRIVYDSGESVSYMVSLVNFTGLPVVVIHTKDGAVINSKETWVDATVQIDGLGDFDDLEELPIAIRGRGNSTWEWPKKPYLFKFDSKTKVLGMPKHKRWVLLANFMDRTMMRNIVAYRLAEQTSLAWTPRCHPVELILNGKHQGNYLLAEQIKVDKNRLNITEMGQEDVTEETLSGGYLLELDFHGDNVGQWYDPHGHTYTYGGQMPFAVKSPEDDEIQNVQYEWIKAYVIRVANLLYGADWLLGAGYWTEIDCQSFVDYWLIYELTINHEIGNPGSVYMHKDRGGRLTAGPVWDFDWGTFSYNATAAARTSLCYKDQLWYARFLQDPSFVLLVKERWAYLKPLFQEVAASYVDERKAYMAYSSEANFALWNPADDKSMNNGYIINGDENMSYSAAVDRMKTILLERIAVVDREIAKL